MAQLTDPLEARVVAILEGARGVDGSLGTDAQNRAMAAGQWRRSANSAPLDDANYPRTMFDRAYEIAWASIADDPDPSNDNDGTAVKWLEFDLHVGFVYGAADDAMVATAGSESGTTAVLAAKARALSECERIKRSLTFYGLVADNTTAPRILDCKRLGASEVRDLGGGRLLGVTRYRFVVEYDNTAGYAP